MIWFCQKGGVEVEAICCEGVDCYAASYINAFAAGRGGQERRCGLCMRISVWQSMSIIGLYWLVFRSERLDEWRDVLVW